MKTILTEKTQDSVTFTVTLDRADLNKALRDGKLSQAALERTLRICCRQALAEQSLEAVEQFQISCGALDPEGGLTAAVTVPYVPLEPVSGYKGVEVKRLTGGDARQRMEEAALEKAVEASGITAPQRLVDNELERLMMELQHKLHYDALATGSMNFFLEKELEEQMDGLRAQAEKQVKAERLLKAVIQAEGLTVTREELEEEARRIAREQNMSLELVEDFLGSDLHLIRDDLLVRKAQALILDHAVLV